MKKKKRAQSRFTLFRRMIILFVAINLVLLFIMLLNNPHVHFHLQNIVHPVTGTFVFSSNRGDGNSYQIYRADFNTAFNSIQITQLTNHSRDYHSPVYSPNGQQVAYYFAHQIYVMDDNGHNQQKVADGINPQWLDDNHLIIHKYIGYQITIHLTTCSIYAPVLVDLKTGEETELYQPPDSYAKIDNNGYYHFPGHQKLTSCTSIYGVPALITEDTRLVPFLDADSKWQQYAYHRTVAMTNTQEKLARITVHPYHDQISGIYVTENFEDWQLVKKVHASHIAWSPEDNYLIYSADHPDGTSVIAITSINGSYTYPLLGNDGFNYFAPNWKP